MKTLSMKKLSLAVLTAACVLGLGVVEAAPKVTVKLSVPKGSAGDDKAAAGKGATWLPCTTASAAFGGLTTVSALDKIQIDLDVANPDDDKDTAKGSDYDLYVLFIDYSATGNAVYALTPPTGSGFANATPVLTPFASVAALGGLLTVVPGTGATALQAAALYGPKAYRFMGKADFSGGALKSTLFGSSIPVEGLSLNQGLWSVMAIMTKPAAAADAGGTLPSPALVGAPVDPSVVALAAYQAALLAESVAVGAVPIAAAQAATLALAPAVTAANDAFKDPRNWAAWSMQSFVLGTPFKTSLGTTGTGVCS